MSSRPASKLPFVFSVALAFATLFLIFVGGLVTSTGSGLSVPDWPLSYGQLMPPMVGGIFYEHGHRLVATTIGFLTILLVVLFHFKVEMPWLRKMAWFALALVIIQGGLGGLTVLMLLPKPVSILHACMAQLFYSLVVALSVWTSRFWLAPPPPREEPHNKIPLHQLTLALFIAGYVQLILGAVVRHAEWGVAAHIIGGFVVLAASGWVFLHARKYHRDVRWLRIWTAAHTGVVVFQILLGFLTYILKNHNFYVIPIPMPAILLITSHVMTGALVLGLSVILALLTYRTRPAGSVPLQTKLSDYYELTKPGISLMAGMTALAGFLIGSDGNINLPLLIHTTIGTLLAAAAAGILNMLIERDIDLKMKRTQKRPLPAGRMNPAEALFLGSLCAVVAIVYLSWAVNVLTAFLAGLTLALYLYVYTPLKKISSLCTAIGAVAGALPPLMGWTAATGSISWPGLILFGILFFWQFPHFFSLAWLYKDDYAQAGLHMLPRVADKGAMTAWSMFLNSIALLLVSLFLPLFGVAGWGYLVAAGVLGMMMTLSSFTFLLEKSRPRARAVFFASIAYVPLLVVVLVAGQLLRAF